MMSGKRDAPSRARNASDRRVIRTRAVLLASFDRLLLARGYDDVSVREITAGADVGRSTFYEHFEGKDDLLEYSVARLLVVLAAAGATGAPSEALQGMLRHVRARRALAGALLQGSARTIMLRVLARELERHLAALARRSSTPPIAPLAFLGNSLAHTQLGAVDVWLGSGACWDVETAARVLHAMTRASVAAMFGPER